jgi:RNA polymerase sigma-70 factor (ECF subfamily)
VDSPGEAPEPSDERLAALAAGGDQAAFAVLVGRHRLRLLKVCYRFTGHHQDAEDALQEALIRAFRGIGEFRGHSRVGTWLYSIAINAARQEAGRQARRPAPIGEEGSELPAPGTAVDGVVAGRVDVQAAFAKLTPGHRAVLILADVCECSYREIAEVLRLSIGTVKTRLFRARKELGKQLGPDWDAEGGAR